MTDWTRETLEIYRNSILDYEEDRERYCFYNEYKNFSICKTVFGLAVYDFAEDHIYIPEIDQNHPEIVKIRKRLEFLNKL